MQKLQRYWFADKLSFRIGVTEIRKEGTEG